MEASQILIANPFANRVTILKHAPISDSLALCWDRRSVLEFPHDFDHTESNNCRRSSSATVHSLMACTQDRPLRVQAELFVSYGKASRLAKIMVPIHSVLIDPNTEDPSPVRQ